MSGPIAVAVMLLVVGYMFRYYNLSYGTASLVYTVFNSNLIFYIVVPVLTMRTFTDERRQKTDQLLLTAPVSLIDIVLGKYFALITVFAVPILVMCILPLILIPLGGGEMMGTAYLSILVFFAMGCAYLSCGMFISSLTDNLIISAIGGILFVFATMIIHNAYSMVSASNFASLIFFIVLAVLLGILVYVMTKFYWASLGVILVCALAAFAAFMVSPDWFGGKSEKILSIFDFFSHFESFAYGSFSIPDLLYFVSVSVAGVVLTIARIQKRRWS
jgi:ABC-2 type transport system permease protein